MNLLTLLLVVVVVLWRPSLARPDFTGPTVAKHAVSPNGNLLVRIKTFSGAKQTRCEIAYYEYDVMLDAFARRSSFQLAGYLSHMLYVSDAGDIAMIGLSEKDSIRIFTKDGATSKTWSLSDFLSPTEIDACAQTGSTLQWLDEAEFHDRTFVFRGPARRVRAMRAPYTVMHAADEKVNFSASIDAATLTLTKP